MCGPYCLCTLNCTVNRLEDECVVTLTLDCKLWTLGFRVKLQPKKEEEEIEGKESDEEEEDNELKRLRRLRKEKVKRERGSEVEFQEISIDKGIWYPVIASWSGGSKGHTEIELIE